MSRWFARASTRLRRGLPLLALAATPGAALASPPLPPHPLPGMVARIPARPAFARTGSQLAGQLRDLPAEERRQVLLDQFLAGNLPSFLRELHPVELELDKGDELVHAVVFVTPDYLALGSDADFVRMPMGLNAATTLARRWGFILPTRKLVDAIHAQSQLKLEPRPMPAGPRMTSVDYLWRHNRTIEAQRAGHSLGALISGHKKDLVVSNRLAERAGRVAIYGWHLPGGEPIQPLSTLHGARYADYSHGVRLVSNTIFIEGQARSIFDVLEDPELAELVSYEGVNSHARRVFAPPPAAEPALKLAARGMRQRLGPLPE